MCCSVAFRAVFTHPLACFQKNSEEQLAELQKLHAEELASREQELTRRLETRERELQEQMSIALVSAERLQSCPATKATWRFLAALTPALRGQVEAEGG